MGTPSARSQTPAPPAGAERRSAERLRVRGLWCDKGQVIDLSTAGMRLRVLRRWNEGHTRTITIVDEHALIPVQARCVWCRQEGLFAHVVGLAFDHVDDQHEAALRAVAERNRTAD